MPTPARVVAVAATAIVACVTAAGAQAPTAVLIKAGRLIDGTGRPALERVQILVGVLNELDKFNNAVNVFSEKRKNPKGEEAAVETVYVGLGAAYFVNEAGDFAGVGAPGASGWEWTTQNEIASAVREVIRIYRNESTARFVKLPATIR